MTTDVWRYHGPVVRVTQSCISRAASYTGEAQYLLELPRYMGGREMAAMSSCKLMSLQPLGVLNTVSFASQNQQLYSTGAETVPSSCVGPVRELGRGVSLRRNWLLSGL